LTSQRSTGVPSVVSTDSYACSVGLAGIHCGVVDAASAVVLNDVDTM
jgi:hypothetical protein